VETVRKAVVAAPAALGDGGLGTAAAEAVAGLRAHGRTVEYVGLQPRRAATRLARSRGVRRLAGRGPAARLVARAVREAVPGEGWELAFAVSGVLPERGDGVRVLHQATRHPEVEAAALRAGERETGGRGDLSRGELRRRLREIERADLIHVTSLAVREEMLAAGVGEERLVHAPLGVDLGRFKPGTRRERPTVAFVGPLSLRKGVDAVAELARRLQGEATVEVVGGPACPWSRRVAAAAPFGYSRSVPELLGEAHLLVLPSRSDGFSYVVLEALAAGAVPVVTPEVGAAEIVARLDPRLVVAREDFVEATAALLGELNLAELSARARELAAEFERGRTSRALAGAVLAAAEGRAIGGGIPVKAGAR
jgi:glycosyltransferase involved in cell wall biosynthesis